MKNRHQVKTHWYYWFWGVCAIAVVSGQLYVGSGYREMAEATKGADIRVTCEVAQLNKTGEFD
jgi:hypothetical protein